ncbi:MAG: hypothetical protein ACLGPM_11770 [Acidobacteriota bacterium]
MSPDNCKEHDRLAAEAHAVLSKLHEITARQLAVFEAGDRPKFIQYDEELELTVGEKERVIGALRQHDEEHGCQLKPL